MPREPPFPGSQIRSIVLRHVNTPSLVSVARSSSSRPQVLISCSADSEGFTNYRRARNVLERDLERLGFRAPFQFSFVGGPFGKQPSPSNTPYSEKWLDPFLKNTTQKYDVIVFMGCNKPSWIIRTPAEVRRIRDHLRSNGRLLVYEREEKGGPLGLVDWSESWKKRTRLHPDTIKEEVNVVKDFARELFTQVEPGVWKKTKDAQPSPSLFSLN